MSRGNSDLVSELNELSLSDATSAREEVISLLEAVRDSERTDLIRQLEDNAGSRLRQVVARAVQTAGVRAEVVPTLERWLQTETDEFTRTAIQDALAPDLKRDRRKPLLNDLDAVPETYRYLTDRVRHRILNVMPGAGLSIAKLKNVAGHHADEQLRLVLLTEADRLSRIFSRLQQAVDFTDDSARFALTKVDLVGWLDEFSRTYRSQWPETDIRIRSSGKPVTEAVPYLLETIFLNLLDNGRQAIGLGGWIEIRVSTVRRSVKVVVSDSGEGLTERAADAAFKLHFSTKGQSGRGLLEVQDATRRLGGTAEVCRISNGNRVMVILPLKS